MTPKGSVKQAHVKPQLLLWGGYLQPGLDNVKGISKAGRRQATAAALRKLYLQPGLDDVKGVGEAGRREATAAALRKLPAIVS